MAGPGAGLSAGLQCELDSRALSAPLLSLSLSFAFRLCMTKSVTLSRHLLVYQRDGEHGFRGPAGDREVREDGVGPCAQVLVWDRVGRRVKSSGCPWRGVRGCVCRQPDPSVRCLSSGLAVAPPEPKSQHPLWGGQSGGGQGSMAERARLTAQGLWPSLL